MDQQRTVIRTDDGAELAVWKSGPSGAEPFLLVHGFSLDHTTWAPLIARLNAAGHRAVALDIRGHGESTRGTASPSVDRYLADLQQVIDELELGPVHLVGHSFGAVIALASRVSEDLAASIKTVTSIGGTERSIQNPVMRVGAYLFSSPVGIWLLGQRMTGRPMISTWFGKKPNTGDLDWIRNISRESPRETRVAIGRATADLDLRPTFAKPGPPTLVLCGRHDKATPLKFSEAIAAAITDSELVVVESAGHMVIIEAVDEVTRHLLSLTD